MLLLTQQAMLCPDYPILRGQEMKIALISWKPFTFVQPDGSLKGFDHDSIELLSELIHFSPKYQLIPTWDEAFLMVQNGSIDTAAKASMSPKRYSMVDMAVSSNFVEVTYGVQVPQPVDVLYQFFQPFEMTVWITWFAILVVFTILIFFATRLAIWKKRQQVGIPTKPLAEVKLIDFPLYSFGMSIQPVLDHKYLLKSMTISGALITIWLAIAGFLVMNLYKTDLLASLTAKTFEKPIDTVKELLQTNLKVYQYDDQSFHQLKDHPRKEFRELYKQSIENDWILSSSQYPMGRQQMYEGEAAQLGPRYYFNYFLSNDIKDGKGIRFRLLKENIQSAPSCIPLPKNGPLTRTFNKFILRAVDHGIFQKLNYYYFQIPEGKYVLCSSTDKFYINLQNSDITEQFIEYERQAKADASKPEVINIIPFYAVFMVYGGLLSGATICFLYEVIHYRLIK